MFFSRYLPHKLVHENNVHDLHRLLLFSLTSWISILGDISRKNKVTEKGTHLCGPLLCMQLLCNCIFIHKQNPDQISTSQPCNVHATLVQFTRKLDEIFKLFKPIFLRGWGTILQYVDYMLKYRSLCNRELKLTSSGPL